MNVNVIVLFFSALIESCMFFLLFDTFLERRKYFQRGYLFIGVFILALMITVSNVFLLFTLGNTLGMVIAAFIMSYCYYGTISRRAFSITLTILIIGISEIVVLYLMSLILRITVEEIVYIPNYQLLGVLISKTLGISICHFIRLKGKKKYFKISRSYYFLFFILFASLILTGALLFQMSYELNVTTYNFLAMICTACLVISSFIALFFYERLAKQNYEIRLQEQYENDLKSQVRHLDDLLVQQKELRRFKHEIKNQLVALNSYFSENKIVIGKQHIEELMKMYRLIDGNFNTGNTALDAIIGTKCELAKSKEIEFVSKIQIPENLKITSVDIGIIFGNALDNAIEACEQIQVGSKYIKFTLIQHGRILFCQVINSIQKGESHSLVTSKSDKLNHGFGLINITETLKKYDSVPVIKIENNEFHLSFTIFFEE